MPASVLKYHDEFAEILKNYSISPRGQAVLKDMRLVLLVAATSTGRSVLVRNLLASGRYHYIVSDTTRPPQVRDGQLEQNGVQYFFRTEEEFLNDLKNGNFLEAEIIHHQQVSGMSIRELEKAAKSGKVAFTEADLAGVANIKKVKPDTLAIFLLPPSFDEWLRRIKGRGGLSGEELNRRLNSALVFWRQAPQLDYLQFLITDDKHLSANVIDELVAGKSNNQHAKALKLCEELVSDLEKFIKSRSD